MPWPKAGRCCARRIGRGPASSSIRTTTSGIRSSWPAGRRWRLPGDPREIIGVGLCTIRCCKAFLKADGSLAQPVMSWMDTRAYQPYLPDDPAVAYATTSSGYITHRFTGEFRDTAANSILLQWPIDTDTWQWSATRRCCSSSTCAANSCSNC